MVAPDLVLGPLLRYVGASDATVWVEADATCEVEVLGRRSRTFHVEGHRAHPGHRSRGAGPSPRLHHHPLRRRAPRLPGRGGVRDGDGVKSPVYQAVCSPLRNSLPGEK